MKVGNFICMDCSKKFQCEFKEENLIHIEDEYNGWDYMPCIFCNGKAKNVGVKSNFSIPKAEIKAIYTDKKGNSIAVDKNGNIVDNHPYENDSRGWKYSGKKDVKY